VQGKYWEYHDILVTTKQLEMPNLKAIARALKLDTDAFDKCLETGEQAGIVKAHMEEAQSLGLQGTPSFFINGRFFSGLLSYETLRGIVEEELTAARAKELDKTAKR
jgi:protein-disulfide isomerase